LPKLVGLLAKTESKDALDTAKEVRKIVAEHGYTPVIEKGLSEALELGNGLPLPRMKVDLMITLGGDGTVLKAVRELPMRRTPILAVNLGRRGYLTEVEPNDFEESFEKWLVGRFQIEEQWLVSVFLKGRKIADCLNEALLLPATPDKMLNVSVSQSGRKIIKARADGFMAATPTGSTAHSFSAGGPVLETSLNTLVLTLIAPLQPVRSLVVPADKRLTVTLERPGPSGMLLADGNTTRQVGLEQSLELKKSSESARFIRFGDTFLQRSLRRLSSERED
jgi:NAD+ kinase